MLPLASKSETHSTAFWQLSSDVDVKCGFHDTTSDAKRMRLNLKMKVKDWVNFHVTGTIEILIDKTGTSSTLPVPILHTPTKNQACGFLVSPQGAYKLRRLINKRIMNRMNRYWFSSSLFCILLRELIGRTATHIALISHPDLLAFRKFFSTLHIFLRIYV